MHALYTAGLLALLSAGAATGSEASTQALPLLTSSANINVTSDNPGKQWPYLSYMSSNNTPNWFNITKSNGKPLAPGYYFVGPGTLASANTLKQSAAFIYTNTGDLVYAANVPGTFNFQTQMYKGQQYLTYWKGNTPNGAEDLSFNGELQMLDHNYRLTTYNPLLNLTTPDQGYQVGQDVDCREQYITPQNTILIIGYNSTPYDLTPVKGSANGYLVNNIVYEMDMETSEILFQWSTLDHIPITASKNPLSSAPIDGNGTQQYPWDCFHINAVSPVGDDYLISMRHTWQVIMINGKTGAVKWILEGEKGGDFGALKSDQTFSWQHYARAHNVTSTSIDISMNDNHLHERFPETVPTKAKVFHLELPPSKKYTPLLTRNLELTSEEYYSGSQGSYEAELSNGNQLHFFGQVTVFREFGPGSTGADLRQEVEFGFPNSMFSYRVYKQEWQGTPADYDPSLVVSNGTAFVSWNGATQVAHWNVYTGAKKGALTKVARATRMGYETMFKVPSGAKFIQLGAVQKNGREVRKSNIVMV